MTEPATTIKSQLPGRTATPSGPACLVCIYPPGPLRGACFTVSDRPLLIGRDADCNVALDDASVSRRHARVQPTVDGYYVVDLKSTNGTYVNDERADRRRLAHGDYLRFGAVVFRFLDGADPETYYHQELYALASRDALTGAHNRRALEEFLSRELERGVQAGRPVSLVLLDIDHFKKINDAHGHLGGDAVLTELCVRLRAELGAVAFLARYGGEEFAVVLPETRWEEAAGLAERLRARIAAQPFAYQGEHFAVTVSAGVATAAPGENWTAGAFFAGADRKLYQAKEEGRNRVVVA